MHPFVLLLRHVANFISASTNRPSAEHVPSFLVGLTCAHCAMLIKALGYGQSVASRALLAESRENLGNAHPFVPLLRHVMHFASTYPVFSPFDRPLEIQ